MPRPDWDSLGAGGHCEGRKIGDYRNWGTIREDSNTPDSMLSLCYQVKAPNISLAGISLVLESGIGSMFGSEASNQNHDAASEF